MNILVTGAAGYIGGRMVEILLKKNWAKTVVGTDINESNRYFIPAQRLLTGFIRITTRP